MEQLDFAFTDSPDNSEQLKLAFNKVYIDFIKLKGIDVTRCIVNDRKVYKLRGEARSIAFDYKTTMILTDKSIQKLTDEQYNERNELTITRNKMEELYKGIITTCRASSKSIPTNVINDAYDRNPFKILGYTEYSVVQEKVMQHVNTLPYYGAYAYSCSCGSGKTLAGIYLMYTLKVKTLVISTRNAVNDQWMQQLKALYPSLRVTDKTTVDADVYVISPQYINNNLNNINIQPGLIIYDEVHSMVSPMFVQAILLPFTWVINGNMSELPYMISLSATYPHEKTKGYKIIKSIFGKPITCKSSITDIPVHIFDYYDHYPVKRPSDRHKGFDMRYPTLNDIEAINYMLPYVKHFNINPTDTNRKGIIMTYTIYTSILAAVMMHDVYNVNVLLIRDAGSPSWILRKDVKYDMSTQPLLNYTKYLNATTSDMPDIDTFDVSDSTSDISVNKLVKCGIGELYKYNVSGFDDIAIIVGTVHRLKEGFSVQNITWGICTKFVWSYITRVQLVGRIRRNSNDPSLNAHKRIFLCYSGKRPSNVVNPHKRKPATWLYDMDYEEVLFSKENYIRIK